MPHVPLRRGASGPALGVALRAVLTGLPGVLLAQPAVPRHGPVAVSTVTVLSPGDTLFERGDTITYRFTRLGRGSLRERRTFIAYLARDTVHVVAGRQRRPASPTEAMVARDLRDLARSSREMDALLWSVGAP